MPSQEDYLDQLLREMESGEIASGAQDLGEELYEGGQAETTETDEASEASDSIFQTEANVQTAESPKTDGDSGVGDYSLIEEIDSSWNPENELPETELSETELPETELPEIELPEMEFPGIESPQTGLLEAELPEAGTEIPGADLPKFSEELPEFSENFQETELPEIGSAKEEPVETGFSEEDMPGGRLEEPEMPEEGISESSISDMGLSDVGISDNGISDAGLSDIGLSNAGILDNGISDMDISDNGVSDMGLSDAGILDNGISDNGISEDDISDNSILDTGISDIGLSDADISDTGLSDTDLWNAELSDDMGSSETDMPIPDPEIEPQVSEPAEPAEPSFDMSDMDELLRFADESAEEEEEDAGDVLSEEEINRILNQNQMEDQGEPAGDSGGTDFDDDLMALLDDTSNADLHDIHDMLQKSDNNEALDNSVFGNDGENPNPWENGEFGSTSENGEDEFAGMSERQKKALLKKRAKEEKAAQKKAEREAKKAEKLAKKAEKKAKKKGGGPAQPAQEEQTAESSDAGLLPEQGLGDVINVSGGEEEGGELTQAEIDAELNGLLGMMGDGEDGFQGAADQDATAPEPEENADTGKKKSFFARILDLLTEEEEDEETATEGTEDIPLSDENKAILDEMDQEEKGKKGKKGKKPKKDKKDKKAKAESADGDEEGEEGDSGKAKKKPKKEKKPKEPKEKVPVDPKNRISLKKLLPIILTCVSLLVVIMLLVNLGGDFLAKQNARRAFYDEDYETCYQDLYGKKLNESEQVMFGKSESILRIRIWMREYEIFAEEGSEVEAVDVLVQATKDYAALYEYAQKWNADGDISVIYGQMLDIMNNKYHLTEAQALEIAAEPNDVEYTRKVLAVATGKGYGAPAQQTIQLPDMLPEEQQFPENNGGQ